MDHEKSHSTSCCKAKFLSRLRGIGLVDDESEEKGREYQISEPIQG